MGAKKFWLENVKELSNIHAERAQKQEDLIPRSSADSLQEVIIPIGIMYLINCCEICYVED